MMLENMRNIALGLGIAMVMPMTMVYGFKLLALSGQSYFLAAIAVGLVAVAAGVLTRLGFVGFGAILGGVFCVIVGYWHHWGALSDVVRFASLLIFLVLMVAASYYSVNLKRK